MRKTFDITLVIDDEERTFGITPSFRAISEIESHEVHRGNDSSLMSMLMRFSQRRQRLSDFVSIVHGALRAQGVRDVTAEEIGESIVQAGQPYFIAPCVDFLNEALGVTDSVKRTIAKGKKSGATGKKAPRRRGSTGKSSTR